MVCVLIGCSSNNQSENDPNTVINPETENTGEDTNPSNGNSEFEVIATNLSVPWEIELMDEVIYISERTGSITRIADGNAVRKMVELDQPLAEQAEAGLLGLAFSPDFDETSQAIAYYSYVDNGEVFQRIATIQEQDDRWVETGTLLDFIPGGQYHQGGRIEIGPDDKLYVTTGDATKPQLAQDKDSLAGKILRMNMDGTIPDDNPFPDSYVYSVGHRNPQGLAWDSQGNLYASEHGNQAHDEINLIEAGNNYGWPVIQGDEQADGMVSPIIHSGETTWAPSGLTFYDNNFYFASLRGEAIRKFNPETETAEIVNDGYGRIRDVMATENGIYFITNNTDGRGSPSEPDDQLVFWRID